MLEALLIGLLLAVIVFTYLIYLNRHYQNPLYKESVLSLFCLCSGAFVATGLGIYFTYHYLPIAIAFELLLAVLLYAHTGISGLLNLTKCLFIAILVLMIPEWISIFGFAAERIFNDSIYHALPKEYMLQPWISFGLPIVAMSGAVYMLRKEKAFSMSLAKAILLFLTLFVYFSIRYTFHETSELYFVRETVIESVIYNSLCYIAAYIFYRGFCHLRWDALLKTAWIFFVIAGLRVVYFDCILLNPLWYELPIRGWFVLNSLNLIYLVPIIASIFVYHGLYGNGYDRYYTKVLWLIAFTGFCYISFQVRYLFQGNLLLSSGFNHLELYAYSVVWLLYAIIVLFLGAFMREVTLRHIAILLFSLSILKVFFVDSYELDGLYRVFSFLCLGIILLAVSSLYTRLANKLTKQAA